jgi:hypothetical protein
MTRGLTIIALGLLLSSFWAGIARADNLEEARRHFAQGVALYNDGNFNAALAEFEAANKLHKSAAVLYNIGLTEKSLFRYNEAIDALTQYLNEEKRLTSERRLEVRQLITEMKALLAPATITVEPDGATITLDGRAIGQSPIKPYGIAAGNHTLEVTLEGYRPVKRDIMISAGVPVSVAFRLDRIPRTARVKITASQPLSAVSVDDKRLGTAPVEAELAGGGHQLVVEAKGYQPFRSELVVTPGQDRVFNAVLELPPSARGGKWYQKWYFWVPVSAVVIGAVAVGLGVGLSKPSPLVGTLDPGAQPVN